MFNFQADNNESSDCSANEQCAAGVQLGPNDVGKSSLPTPSKNILAQSDPPSDSIPAIPPQSRASCSTNPVQSLQCSDVSKIEPCSLQPQLMNPLLLPLSSKKNSTSTETKKKKILSKKLKKKNTASSSSRSLAPCSSKPKHLLLSNFLDALPKDQDQCGDGGRS